MLFLSFVKKKLFKVYKLVNKETWRVGVWKYVGNFCLKMADSNAISG